MVLTYTLAWVIVWPSPRPRQDDHGDRRAVDPRGRQRRIVFTTGAAVMVVSVVVSFERYASPGLVEQLAATIAATPRRVSQAGQALLGRSASSRHYDERLQPVRGEAAALPTPRGSTDLYPYDNALLIVSGAEFNPRPVFQSYSAYTPHLAEMNAAHLRGPDAPASLLFSLNAIDERWMTLEDGPSYLELLSRYRPVEHADTYWLLTRLSTPRSLRLEALEPIVAEAGETIQIPDPRGAPLYAQLDVRPTLLHAVASPLYKSAPLYMAATLADGRVVSGRLVPGMARAGFILSPCLVDEKQFGPFWEREPKLLGDSRPTTLAIGVHGPDGQRLSPSAFYAGYTLKLFRIDVHEAGATPSR